MSTQTVSTLNGVTQTAGASASLIISANALPNLLAITGYCNGTTNAQYFLQLFNQATVPADTAVPLYSWQVLGTDGFLFNFRPDGLDTSKLKDGILNPASGLILCLSTTEGTLTIGTGNITMDVQVDLDSPQGIIPIPQTFVGDTTTAVASLTVAADPSQNKLVSYNVKNSTGADGYLMLFAYSNPSTGAVPLQQWKITNGTRDQRVFGGGFFLSQIKPTDRVVHTGIYLYGSSTTQTFTATAANWNMQASYI